MRSELLFLLTLAAQSAAACEPNWDVVSRMKNLLVLEAANEAFADLSAATLKLSNYDHRFEWIFTEPDYECHDADITSADVELSNFPQMGNPDRTCSAVVRVKLSRVPENSETPGELKTEVNKVSENCHE